MQGMPGDRGRFPGGDGNNFPGNPPSDNGMGMPPMNNGNQGMPPMNNGNQAMPGGRGQGGMNGGQGMPGRMEQGGMNGNQGMPGGGSRGGMNDRQGIPPMNNNQELEKANKFRNKSDKQSGNKPADGNTIK